MSEIAEKGKLVKIDYTGTFEDGSVFDTSVGKQPMEFVVGVGMVVKGFDEAVLGMKIGEVKDVVLSPEKAYGEVRPELINKVPRSEVDGKLGDDKKPEVGMVLGMQIPGQKQVIPARVTAVDEKEITIDLNPPLAGKTLKFNIKLIEVNEAPAEDHNCCGHKHDGDSCEHDHDSDCCEHDHGEDSCCGGVNCSDKDESSEKPEKKEEKEVKSD